MAKLIRKYPVLGEEHVLTAAGLLVFLNGEAELEDEKVHLVGGISDIHVRQAEQSVPATEEEEAAKKAAEEEKAAKLAAEAEILQKAAAVKAQQEEEAKQAAEDAAKQAAEDAAKQAAEDAAKQAAEETAKKAAEEAAKTKPIPPAPATGKKLPPAVK